MKMKSVTIPKHISGVGEEGWIGAGDLNPHEFLILFGSMSISSVQTERLSPFSACKQKQTSGFLLVYRDVPLFYRLFVTGGGVGCFL